LGERNGVQYWVAFTVSIMTAIAVLCIPTYHSGEYEIVHFLFTKANFGKDHFPVKRIEHEIAEDTFVTPYSFLKLFTGFTSAALMD
jgi:hypothetical protein